jgi:hypothetical protein
MNIHGPILFRPIVLDDKSWRGGMSSRTKLSFVASKPPTPHIAYQELQMAAETDAEYFS